MRMLFQDIHMYYITAKELIARKWQKYRYLCYLSNIAIIIDGWLENHKVLSIITGKIYVTLYDDYIDDGCFKIILSDLN